MWQSFYNIRILYNELCTGVLGVSDPFPRFVVFARGILSRECGVVGCLVVSALRGQKAPLLDSGLMQWASLAGF